MSAVELLALLDQFHENFILFYNKYKKENGIRTDLKNIANDFKLSNNVQAIRNFLIKKASEANA